MEAYTYTLGILTYLLTHLLTVRIMFLYSMLVPGFLAWFLDVKVLKVQSSLNVSSKGYTLFLNSWIKIYVM